MAIDAANAGTRGIFCEKPMAMNLREADRMLDACRASGSRLIINHQRYYEPAYVRARAMLAEDAIGSIRSAEAYCRASTLLGDGTHAIHMLLCLMRNRRVSHLIGQVDAHWSEGPDPMPQSENSGVAFLALEQDTWAYLTWGRASGEPEGFLHPGDWYRYYQSFVIYGDEGRLEIGSDGPEDELRYLRIRRGPQVEHVQGLNQMDKITLHRSCITMAIRDLVCSIETGCSHPLDGEGGRDVMEIIMAIYESARMHECVKLQSIGSPMGTAQVLPSRIPLSRLVHTRISPLDLMIDSGHLPMERPGRYDVRSFLLKGEETAREKRDGK